MYSVTERKVKIMALLTKTYIHLKLFKEFCYFVLILASNIEANL